MRDAALDGAVAAIVAWRVQVLGHRPAGWDRKSFHSCSFSSSPKPTETFYIHPTLSGLSAFFPPQQSMNKHLSLIKHWKFHSAENTSDVCYLPPCNIWLLFTLLCS